MITTVHQQLKENALKAIERLRDDTSVEPEQVVETLSEISLELHATIHSILEEPVNPQFA